LALRGRLRAIDYITSLMLYHPDAVERTQISLESAQARLLRRVAAERGVSMAHLIRDAVNQAYATESVSVAQADVRAAVAWLRATAFRSGSEDLAEEHDRELEEDFSA
jgi:Ribbon-helix-helix protein, copG family